RTATKQYDFYTGLVTQVTDVENNVIAKTTYDALGRPTLVQEAYGTAIEKRTATEYSDSLRRVVVRADKDVTGDGKLVSIQHYDQLGRGRLSRMLEDATTQDPYNEQHGIKVQTRYFSGSASYPNTTSWSPILIVPPLPAGPVARRRWAGRAPSWIKADVSSK